MFLFTRPGVVFALFAVQDIWLTLLTAHSFLIQLLQLPFPTALSAARYSQPDEFFAASVAQTSSCFFG